MSTIEDELLLRVCGGQGDPPAYNFADGTGRVGPGMQWKWLGNHYPRRTATTWMCGADSSRA